MTDERGSDIRGSFILAFWAFELHTAYCIACFASCFKFVLVYYDDVLLYY
jgi:hypothetical protein